MSRSAEAGARRRRTGLLLVGLMLSSALLAAAPPYAVGDALTPLTLADQHGRSRSIDEQTQLLVFAPDRAAGQLLAAAFAATAGPLEQNRPVFLADISGMPSLVARFIALPKMRSYPYPLLLATEAAESARLPRRSGLVTLIRLERLQVIAITYAQTPDEILAAVAASKSTD